MLTQRSVGSKVVIILQVEGKALSQPAAMERITHFMSDKAQDNYAQQFEHAIATAFTCRSIIKYNSTLSELQINEVLTDIDETVHFLQQRLTANKVIETNLLFSQLQQFGSFSSDTIAGSNAENDDYTSMKQKFDSLYKLYHYYFDVRPGQGTGAFIARFNDVMSTIDQVQLFVEKHTDPLFRTPLVEDHLHKVRGYIADMYTVFTEFARATSNVLQGQNIYIDTEKQASLQQPEDEETPRIHDLAPFITVYKTHQKLNEIMATVASRISDATAFLIFLQDQLSDTLNKRDEVIRQLNNVATLLNDLSCRLADYENVISALLRQ
jgi:hypothetical protein